jgi:hypothetical protein
MPDAMMNGGFAPYLAQAFTPQGVQSGLFGGGVGNFPGNIFTNPTFGQNYGQGAIVGGGLPFMAPSQLGQAYSQPYTGWQQPWQLGANPLGQIAGQIGGSLGWPHPQAQLGQTIGQPHGGGQEPLILAQLLRQYAVPISAVMASPYGQPHIAQHIVQTAEMLMRVLPLVGAPQLTPLAQLLGQNAVPISAAIASPYGQAHIAQNLLQTAEILARVLPVVSQSQLQPNLGWQQQTVPQLPIAHLLGQQQQYSPQQAFSPFGGQGQFGQFSTQSGDLMGRIPPFLAQQGLAGQAYGVARV